MTIFKIGNNDYSNRVISGSYQMQNNPDYQSWIDGWGREHRYKNRDRISGKFNMWFPSIEEFNAFNAVVAQNTLTDLTCMVTVFDNLSNSEKTINAFISYTPTRSRKPDWTDNTDKFSVTITER